MLPTQESTKTSCDAPKYRGALRRPPNKPSPPKTACSLGNTRHRRAGHNQNNILQFPTPSTAKPGMLDAQIQNNALLRPEVLDRVLVGVVEEHDAALRPGRAPLAGHGQRYPRRVGVRDDEPEV